MNQDKSIRKVFHVISYLQYPILIAGLGFYIPFMISLFNKSPDWNLLNYVLILLGISLSFSTLQDTSTTQNEFSKKIWQYPIKGKITLIIIAIFAFSFIIIGLLALYLFKANHSESVAVGIAVVGIGMIGLLKAAIEMFENHRLDKNRRG